ncbi:hypothetical protein GKZ28_22655 [Clostridium chromiireducens]|uniref:Uncharacterized protein n=1 Tax=Clostridium chromiireducens TaxID=225345 RepID=A0A964RRN7_9CLOT|nr:hypothetical protein [Clostridium chromiireducens]MVX66480.1 hypothetical protein [Clostridium chromiireducens]
MLEKIDYKKLKKDLLNKVGSSGIMPLIVSIDSASEKELLELAKEYNLNISDYIKN